MSNARPKAMAMAVRPNRSAGPKPRQQQQQQRVRRPARPRRGNRGRARRGRGANRNNNILCDPFICCALAPPTVIGAAATVPDGDATPCFSFEHHQVISVKAASTGDITFAFIASPGGAIGMGIGVWQQITTNNVGAAGVITGQSVGNILSSTSPMILANQYPLIPYKDWLINTGGNAYENRSLLNVQQYKITGCSARVMYTGTDFANSGVGITVKLNMRTGGDISGDFTGSLIAGAEFGPLMQRAPLSFSEISALSGARIFPITETVDLCNVIGLTDYLDVKDAWFPATINVGTVPTATGTFPITGTQPFCPIATGPNATGGIGMPGLGTAPVTFFAAQGMDPAQTLTITIHTCVQYVPGFASPMQNMSMMPDPARPAAITALQRIARTMPSSKPASVSWLSGVGDLISSFAAPIGAAIAGPLGAAAGGLMSTGITYGMEALGIRPSRQLALQY